MPDLADAKKLIAHRYGYSDRPAGDSRVSLLVLVENHDARTCRKARGSGCADTDRCAARARPISRRCSVTGGPEVSGPSRRHIGDGCRKSVRELAAAATDRENCSGPGNRAGRGRCSRCDHKRRRTRGTGAAADSARTRNDRSDASGAAGATGTRSRTSGSGGANGYGLRCRRAPPHFRERAGRTGCTDADGRRRRG